MARLLLVARSRVSGSRRIRTIADALMADIDLFEWLANMAFEPEVSSFSSALKLNEQGVSESAPSQKRGQVLTFRKPERETSGDPDGE